MDEPVLDVAMDSAKAGSGETFVRAAALPGSLLFAWIIVKILPGPVRLVTMWVHETGHAVAAWLCGYQAFPGPWFTPVTTERSPLFTLVLAALLVAGGYRAWQRRRPFWIAAAVMASVLMLFGGFVLSWLSSQQFIVFFGDGGSLVLGTLMMFTIYAPETGSLHKNQIRLGLLAIGALAFMDAFATWTGPIDQLPFGENENGLSDPTVLTEQFGWTTSLLVDRYRQLSYVCLAVMAIVYLFGLVKAGGPRAESES